jgi:hypothetical protein
MSFETRVSTIDRAGIGILDTQRTDFNDAAANSALQAITGIAALVDINTVIVTATHQAPIAGQVYTWEITSGNGAGHLVINNQGQIKRVNGQTLVGPYTLVVRHTESGPLFRYRDADITIAIV